MIIKHLSLIEVTSLINRNRCCYREITKKNRAREAGAQARAAVTRTTSGRRESENEEVEREREKDVESNGSFPPAHHVSVVRTSFATRDVPVSRAVIPRGKWRGVKCGVTTQSSRPKGERFVYRVFVCSPAMS